MNVLFELALIISFASLGVRAITDKGMIGYFLRRPFERMQDEINDHNEQKASLEYHKKVLTDECSCDATKANAKERIERINKRMLIDAYFIPRYKLCVYVAKPILTCSTCMASVHTLIWFPILVGAIHWKIIPVMLMVAFFNTVGWLIVESLRQTLKRRN